MYNLLLICIIINGFITEYSNVHISLILLLSTILMFGILQTLWMIMIIFLMNYTIIIKLYGVIKRTLNNLIKLNELSEIDHSTDSTKEINTLKSIQSKILWFDDNLIQKITFVSTQIVLFSNEYKNSILEHDICNLLIAFDHLILLINSIGLECYNISKELPKLGYFISRCEEYYITSLKLYKHDLFNNLMLSENQIDSNNLDYLDNLNNLFETMLPALQNNSLNNSFNNSFNNIIPSKNQIDDLDDLNKLNNLFSNKMPSDKELMNMFCNIGNIGNIGNMCNITQYESKQKKSFKKKKV